MAAWVLAKIGSGFGLLPVQHQATTLTSAASLSMGRDIQEKNVGGIWTAQIPFKSQEKVFENVGCQMLAILSRSDCVEKPALPICEVSLVIFIQEYLLLKSLPSCSPLVYEGTILGRTDLV